MIYIIEIISNQVRLFVDDLMNSSVSNKIDEVLSYIHESGHLKLKINTEFSDPDLQVISDLIENHDDTLPSSDTAFWKIENITGDQNYIENRQKNYVSVSSNRNNRKIFSMEKPENDELKEVLIMNTGRYKINLERNDYRGNAKCRFMYSGKYSLNPGRSVRVVYIEGFWRIIS